MPHEAPRVLTGDGDGQPSTEPARRDGYPRAACWEAAAVQAELAGATGVTLTDASRCRGGQIGACYVRWPDGHLSVLTTRPPGKLAAASLLGTYEPAAR